MTKRVFEFKTMKEAFAFQDECEKRIHFFEMLSWGFLERPTYVEVNVSWPMCDDKPLIDALNAIYHKGEVKT